jgi:hypothetical protein
MSDPAVLLLTPYECIAIAQGRTMGCQLEDGTPVSVRLPTLAEARAINERARTSLGLVDSDIAPPSDAQLEAMIRPMRTSASA